MIENIINAISTRLYDLFGDEYTIYIDDVQQGLKEPCFIITIIELMRNDYLRGRYNISVPFDIIYIPKNNNYNVYSVSEILLDNLDFVENADHKNKYIGRNMRSEVIEKELHFFVDYNCIKNAYINEGNDMNEIAMERK